MLFLAVVVHLTFRSKFFSKTLSLLVVYPKYTRTINLLKSKQFSFFIYSVFQIAHVHMFLSQGILYVFTAKTDIEFFFFVYRKRTVTLENCYMCVCVFFPFNLSEFITWLHFHRLTQFWNSFASFSFPFRFFFFQFMVYFTWNKILWKFHYIIIRSYIGCTIFIGIVDLFVGFDYGCDYKIRFAWSATW